MELKGKVYEIKPVESGEGRNGAWQKQLIVLEMENGKYPKKVAIQFWSDLVNHESFVQGNDISIEADVESREFNGKWYTDVKGWRVNKNTSYVPAQQQTTTSNESTTNSTSTPDFDGQTPQIDDDLPF